MIFDQFNIQSGPVLGVHLTTSLDSHAKKSLTTPLFSYGFPPKIAYPP